MRLSYSSLIGYSSIPLYENEQLIGHIRKPTLAEIDKVGWQLFEVYKCALTMQPKELVSTMIQNGKELWSQLLQQPNQDYELFDVVIGLTPLSQLYLDLLQFFFEEPIIFANGRFWTLKHEYKPGTDLSKDDVYGSLSRSSFNQTVDIIQCICCIHDASKDEDAHPKFKNKLAEELYKKMHEDGQKEQSVAPQKRNVDMTTANIISVVATHHHSLNYTNIYQLTIAQLYDVFHRMLQFESYDLNKRSVTIWGDEKHKFDPSAWYHNIHEE